MNVSLPEELKHFVDERVATRGFGTSSEYVRELLCREQDRQHLRKLVLDGMASGRGQLADAACFQSLREKIAERPRATGGAARSARRR